MAPRLEHDNAAKSLRDQVRERYGAAARGENLLGQAGAEHAIGWAQRFGYRPKDLEDTPDAANTGLGCGNPTAHAQLRPGEVVVDLGCGAGLDLVLAAQSVGPDGRAIGVDMTVDMISRARRAIRSAGLSNAEARLSPMERLPLESESVDVVISNCAINLSPEKDLVLQEIHRVLKPGGRLTVSDMVLSTPLPEDVGALLDAYVGCVGGALLKPAWQSLLVRHGFDRVIEQSCTPLDSVLEPDHPYIQLIVDQAERNVDAGEIRRVLSTISSLTISAFRPGSIDEKR